jgi:hypothetical protein
MASHFANQACRINAIFRAGSIPALKRIIEIVPLQKIVTVLPEDTFGISRILSDYTVETMFRKLGDASTKVEIRHFITRRQA